MNSCVSCQRAECSAMANPVLVEAVARRRASRAATAAPSRSSMRTGAAVLALGDVERPVYPALGRQGAAGAGAGRIGRARTASLRRRGTGARLRVARRRARPRGDRRPHARPRPGSMPARSNAAPTGRCTSRRRRRWRARARAPRRSTTTAPASTPASCAPPARWACRTAATSRRRIRCSARSRPCWKASPASRSTTSDVPSTDCSVPTWAIPLTALARAFARFGTGHGLGAARAQGGRAAACRLCRQAVVRRRHQSVLQRDHGAFRRARLRQDRRGRRRSAAPCRSRASASRSSATTGQAAPPRRSWRR